MVACAENGDALKHASDALRGDREVVTVAIKQNARALKYALELRGDRRIVSLAVAKDWGSLQYASRKLQADRGIALMALLQDFSGAMKVVDEATLGDGKAERVVNAAFATPIGEANP
jgi:hypothetical protein